MSLSITLLYHLYLPLNAFIVLYAITVVSAFSPFAPHLHPAPTPPSSGNTHILVHPWARHKCSLANPFIFFHPRNAIFKSERILPHQNLSCFIPPSFTFSSVIQYSIHLVINLFKQYPLLSSPRSLICSVLNTKMSLWFYGNSDSFELVC